MNAEQVDRLCARLGLGRALGEPAPVAEGFLHRMSRLETERGVFAVKDVSRVGFEHEYRLAQAIARAAAERGVRAQVALLVAGSPVVRLGGTDHPAVIVYPWVEGTDEPRDALYAVLVNWLAWLSYTASQVIELHGTVAELEERTGLDPLERRRVRGVIARHTDEIARFDGEVKSTLTTVERIAASLDRYASWLSG